MSINKSFGDFETLAGDTGRVKAQSFPDGSRLGEYRIIRLLGRGGMGEVYEVEHSTLCRRYAMKVLPADFAAMPGAVERFRREARVMANLEHPNILKVDEFGEVGGRYWLRMEIARGITINGDNATTLAKFAELSGGRIDQVLFEPILRQVLEAMTYAHSRGVVHRDLKPSNILLEGKNESANRRNGESEIGNKTDDPASSGTAPWQASDPTSPRGYEGQSSDFLVKISDFGLVRLVGEEWIRSQVEISVKHSMTMGDMRTIGAGSQGASTKSLIGTYEYMSPEQKRGEDADKRSDVYALGLMCYRLLTGRNLSMKKPSAIIPILVSGWNDFIAKAVEEEAAERYADAGEMLEDFRKIIDDITTKERRHEAESENGKVTKAQSCKGIQLRQGATPGQAEAQSRMPTTDDKRPTTAGKFKIAASLSVLLCFFVFVYWNFSNNQAEKTVAERIKKKNEQSQQDRLKQDEEARRLQQEADKKRQDDETKKSAEAAKAKEDQKKQLENENRKVEVKERNDSKSEISNQNQQRGSGPVPGIDWTIPNIGMEFVWIKALDCWVGKYEVTNGEYRKFKPDHDSKDYKGNSLNGDRQPVVYVNYDDACEYAKWLTERERKAGRLPLGYSYRLPTNDEWTTFAQCGDKREYPWGSTMPPKYGNYSGQESLVSGKTDGYNDGFPVTCPVERSGKNDWELYGVGGNVWECTGKSSSDLSFDAWRGASWYNSNLDTMRSSGAHHVILASGRVNSGASARIFDCGFRLVLSR